MANTPYTTPWLYAVDIQHLQYFAVVAHEGSLRRAAELLFIAQPPLSRQIKQLEERLGVLLFMRHSKGLTLTPEGAKVLSIIQPLLRARETTFARLRKALPPQHRSLRIGFSTAFEQGIFARLEAHLGARAGCCVHVHRGNSPKLAMDVRKGRLDAALVALPLASTELLVREIPYAEPLIAAISATWPEAAIARSKKPVSLSMFNKKRLFWFKRERNPAFFDATKGYFAQVGFTPQCIEEPVEHDVLLARIASGEALGLFAASFASIVREGVVFAPLAEKSPLMLRLGVITLPANAAVGEEVSATFLAELTHGECG